MADKDLIGFVEKRFGETIPDSEQLTDRELVATTGRLLGQKQACSCKLNATSEPCGNIRCAKAAKG